MFQLQLYVKPGKSEASGNTHNFAEAEVDSKCYSLQSFNKHVLLLQRFFFFYSSLTWLLQTF